MSDQVVESLILDLLEWLATNNRTYEETMTRGALRVPNYRCGKMRMIVGWSASMCFRGNGSSGLPRRVLLFSNSSVSQGPNGMLQTPH